MTRTREGAQLAVGILIAAILVSPTMAEIPEVSGDILIIEPPASVSLSSLEDDFLIKLFREQSNVFLKEYLLVDISEAGTVNAKDNLTTKNIFEEVVDSYFLHVDPIDNGHPPKEYAGSVVFPEEILGVIVTGRVLDLSDLVLGAVETSYAPRDIYRGFEGPGFPASNPVINDSLELMPDLRTISLNFKTTSRLDQIRIITRSSNAAPPNVVPEPPAGLLLVTGLLFSMKAGRTSRHLEEL